MIVEELVETGLIENADISTPASMNDNIKAEPAIRPAGEATGSQAVLEALIVEKSIRYLGIPAVPSCPFTMPCTTTTTSCNTSSSGHEQGAIHAAQGYARTSGRTGVVFATSGPGATNLVTGLADAMIDSTPLVCITGQVFAHLLGTDAFQETDVIISPPPLPSGTIR